MNNRVYKLQCNKLLYMAKNRDLSKNSLVIQYVQKNLNMNINFKQSCIFFVAIYKSDFCRWEIQIKELTSTKLNNM